MDGTIKLCFEQASCSLDLTLFQDLPLGYQSCVPTDPVPFQGLSIFELLNKLMNKNETKSCHLESLYFAYFLSIVMVNVLLFPKLSIMNYFLRIQYYQVYNATQNF